MGSLHTADYLAKRCWTKAEVLFMYVHQATNKLFLVSSLLLCFICLLLQKAIPFKKLNHFNATWKPVVK